MRPIFHSQIPRGSSQFLPELLGHNSGFVPGPFQTIDTVQPSQMIDNQLTLYSTVLLATLQTARLIRTSRTSLICIRNSSIVTECLNIQRSISKDDYDFRSNQNLKNKLTI